MRPEGALATVIVVSSDPPFEGLLLRPIPAAFIERQWSAIAALIGLTSLTVGLNWLGRPSLSSLSPEFRS
jgi:hypothetical protein